MPLLRHALFTALKIFIAFAIIVLLVSWWAYSRDAAGVGEDNAGGWLLLYLMIPVMLALQVLGFAMGLPEVTLRYIIIGSIFYFLLFAFVGLWWAWLRQKRNEHTSAPKITGR